ncbi:MAG: FtsX-like permease family protein [Oscillatoriales cyanobacterium SM2_2_1]|nr:FtsX-like permease family protein [Oscillatoriales cyanobacterium SM2_2_1]
MVLAIPLAWLQLTHQKSRLMVAIAGITFAVILIFMQIGFQDALFRSAVRLQSNLLGDVVLISPQSTNLVGMRNFSQRRLFQSYGFPEVNNVSAIYIGLAAWKIQEDVSGSTRNILVLGASPNSEAFLMPGVRGNLDRLREQDVVLFDRTSRAEFGPIVAECGMQQLLNKDTNDAFRCDNYVTREVGNRKITVGGLFELGSSFAADGAIVTSETNFLRIFDNRRPGLINVGLITLNPGSSPYRLMLHYIQESPVAAVFLPRGSLQPDGTRIFASYSYAGLAETDRVDSLGNQDIVYVGDRRVIVDKQQIKKGAKLDIGNGRILEVREDPDKVVIAKLNLLMTDLEKTNDASVDDVRLLTREGFIAFERTYWQRGTAIGFIFSLGTVMGFIVGIVIVYQILYTDVSDHMAEYATLKAMGYSNLYLSAVVIQEAFVLSILGYIPAFLAAVGLYNLTRDATRLPIEMTLERGIQVMILTIVMCTISGAISLRKVQSADPAEMFS